MAVALKVLGATSAPVGPKKRQNTKENKGLVHSGGAHVGNQKISQKLSDGVALVSFCTGAFPCSVALVFQFLMFQWVVQHGLSEGVRNVIKIMVFDDFGKLEGSKGRPTNGLRRA